MKPFNFNDGSREQIRRDAQARARFHRWQAPGRARVEHPAHGSVVVPHASNLAAILNAAEVWRCNWATILDAKVWAADPSEPVAKMPPTYLIKEDRLVIIEEKGLVKAIKIAYRHGGYTVLNQGGEVTIYTEGWFVRCLWPKLPRKALATIVEHMGMIPDDGEAVAIEKDNQPQAIMAGIVSDDVDGWMGGEVASMASYVPVTFRGYQLFQEVSGRQAYGVDPTALAIIERVTAEMGTAAISGGRALTWSHDGETVMLEAIRKTTWAWEWERTVWEALESVDLHKREG